MTTKNVVANIPQRKTKAVSELIELIRKHKTILIASIKNLPGSQFQEIGKKLRGKAVVKVPKKNLIFRAIDESGNGEVKKIKEQIIENAAILFSELDSYDLAAELIKRKSPAKAKPGQEAPFDIEVEAGMTDLVPGPAISELGAVGLKTKVTNGKLEIIKDTVIVKEGKPISQAVADVMAKLDIKPFSIGFIPLSAFDTKENKLYLEIKIDKDEAIKNLKEAFGQALSFAVEIGYLTEETVKVMVRKAAAEERKIIRVITGEPGEEVAPAGVSPLDDEGKTQSKEKKEEPKADASAGLASLFG